MEAIPTPCKENEFLGFCPSAVKLQNGDKKTSLKKRTDYHDSFAATGVTTFRCAEKGCAFQGHVSVDFVWKVVMKDEKLGLQCRWAFLAKSHVCQAAATSRQYHFQCPICIFSQGHAEGRVWKGTAIYLDHVSTHRGKDINPEVLHKLNIINEYVATEKEAFDLNLFPPGFDNRSGYASSDSQLSLAKAPTHSSVLDKVWSRKESTAPVVVDPHSMLERRPTYMTLRDRADSVVTVGAGAEREVKEENVEPWSAGLSEFHKEREIDYLSADF
ncbi:hypothetical protein LTR91_015149 [Friedmanniomyces endolithicus]|uniref:Uncharacterized protein n=1 Tax=Friedmanniomyces endolithicus TaxID=329885 RepID=A0AAN6KAN1_9PEZI|nr:hypothetical protein LTR59_002913 [Friedmanniomyces endolithicus]KAK0853786.1 hypothetical protein LTR03_002748 [Friedmanniomyces endolithicus]KAK0884972.1 hypothetical protein LTR87_001370 [Friedmanniomyces endolithicus]KAK0972427.1 hypothetical protein LTR91_015149 [Friedmanniomyces endolithicus]KAK1036877.1 hypothetical protein LTS16_013299 [Friedmanniomyces endolithicus]